MVEGFQLIYMKHHINNEEKKTQKITQTFVNFDTLQQQLTKLANDPNIDIVSIGRCYIKPLTTTQKKSIANILVNEQWQMD